MRTRGASDINQGNVGPIDTFVDDVVIAGGTRRIGSDPGVVGKVGIIQRWRVRDKHIVVYTIEAKSLTYFASRKCGTILKQAVVAVLDISRVTVSRPPTDHVRRRRDTGRSTLTQAARVVESGNLGCTQRAVEHFDFINCGINS